MYVHMYVHMYVRVYLYIHRVCVDISGKYFNRVNTRIAHVSTVTEE